MNTSILCAAIGLTPIALATTTQASLIEWRIAQGGNGHFYEVVNVSSSIDWTTARDLAVQSGGYLATLTNAQENSFVADLVQANNENAFLGGFQVDPTAPPNVGWTWVTGETWDYTSWANGEPNDQGSPNEPVLEMWTNREWNDCPFSGSGYSQFAYVVEYAAPAPGALALIAIAGATGSRRRRVPL